MRQRNTVRSGTPLAGVARARPQEEDHHMRPDLVYPQTERLELVEDLHGHRVADPYRYLEDVTDPRTVAWSMAQDQLYEAQRAAWPARDGFHARLSTLHAVGSVSAPVWRGDRAFTLHREPDQDHSVLLVREPDGVERVLIDPMAIDPSGETTLDFYQPSPDGDRLAYGLSEGGTENSVVRVMDVVTGEIIDGPIDRARHTIIAWLPDGTAFFYARQLPDDAIEDAYLYRRVHRHLVGADPDSDEVVFGEGSGRGMYYGLSVSPDGRWLIVAPQRGTDDRNDVYLADLAVDPARFTAVQTGVDAATTMEIGHDGRAYLLTNRDAPRWRLCVADPAALAAGYSAWQTLLPEDPTAVLVDYVRLDGPQMSRPAIVARRIRHAISELTVHDLQTGAPMHDIALPGIGAVEELTARKHGHEAWFSYTDFTTPGQILRYDATTAAVDVWATPAGDARTSVRVITKHVTFQSYDDTDVRLFLVAQAEPAPGPARAILYGYGGFNLVRPPVYDPYILAWIEQGGIFALVSLRGGGEEGEAWHQAGRRGAKQNVFDDFASAADWLVAQGLTTPAQLAIFGGSNGGLLVGAALTQHPEKYGAVVCSAPLLDMIRYERFGLGETWNGEYGSAADPTEFEWLYAYSPYHHVTEGAAYPAVVFTVFEGDTRVDPLHARKLCAALQHATSSGKPVLIRREQNVGHASRAVSRTVDLAADRLAFFTAMLPATSSVSAPPQAAPVSPASSPAAAASTTTAATGEPSGEAG
jgi:prolyl oligopeptidase